MELINKIERPMIQFGKQLFRDEKNAAVFSATITAFFFFVIWFIWGSDAPQWIFSLVLPLAAPLFEKPFLFLAYFLQARRMWQENKKDKKYFEYFKVVWHEEDAGRILKADILYHDTLSWFFMFVATFLIPDLRNDFNFYTFLTNGTGLWEIGITGCMGGACFTLAVIGAAILEVKVTDYSFVRFQKRVVEKLGFCPPEEYCEMIYLVVNDKINEDALREIRRRQELELSSQSTHSEVEILKHNLKRFNGWKPYLQIRNSTETGVSIQIIYETPFKIKTGSTDAFRCFAVKKKKWKLAFKNNNSDELTAKLRSLGLIPDDKLNVFSVKYQRRYFYNPETLSISVDTVCGNEKLSWIEVKAWMARSFEDVLRSLNEVISISLHVRPSTRRKSRTMEIFLNGIK